MTMKGQALCFEGRSRGKTRKTIKVPLESDISTSATKSHILWQDKYEPRSSKELATHSSRVKSVQEWLRKHVLQRSNESGLQPVLVLCGCSGCCKSTLVKVLCSELGISMTEWTDDMCDSTGSPNTTGDWQAGNTVLPIEKRYSRSQVYSTSSRTEVADLALRSSYKALGFSTSSKSNSQVKGHSEDRTVSKNGHIILVHDPNLLLEPISSRERGVGIVKTLVAMRHPVVLILSDVPGKDDSFFAVDELIPKHLHNRVNLEVIYCTPITPLNAQKILSRIAAVEFSELNGHWKRSEKQLPQPVMPSKRTIEFISESCLGDLRHAISQLQALMLGGNTCVAITDNTQSSGKRDTTFSSLYGVAKLLHSRLDESYRLPFAPEEVLQNLGFPLDIALAFLQHNCIAIFMDIQNRKVPLPHEELDALERAERALEDFCDADIIMQRQYTTSLQLDRSDTSFLTDAAESIISRASSVSSSVWLQPVTSSDAGASQVVDLTAEDVPEIGSKRVRTTEGTSIKRSESKGMTPVRRPRSLDIMVAQQRVLRNVSALKSLLSDSYSSLSTLSTAETIITLVPYVRYMSPTDVGGSAYRGLEVLNNRSVCGGNPSVLPQPLLHCVRAIGSNRVYTPAPVVPADTHPARSENRNVTLCEEDIGEFSD